VNGSREEELRQRLAAERKAPDSVDAGVLDPIDYAYKGRPLDIEIHTDEFGHICPMTGLPDSGALRIRYVPDGRIIELKSLKYYLVQYRQVGIFYEHVVHRILDDLWDALSPQHMVVRYETQARGGIRSVVEAARGDERR
jgi:7-cyano-7-deazaguanine reductase